MRKRQSQTRRNRRQPAIDLSGPMAMYKQLKESFDMFVFDEGNGFTYDQLLNHYSGLWQEYCARKNKFRDHKDKLNVEPRYFWNENRKRESVFYKGGTILEQIRKRAIELNNNVNIES